MGQDNLGQNNQGAWRKNQQKRFQGTVKSLINRLGYLNEKDLRIGLEGNAQSLGLDPKEIVVAAYSSLKWQMEKGRIEPDEVNMQLEILARAVDSTSEEIIEAARPKTEDDSETSTIS